MTTIHRGHGAPEFQFRQVVTEMMQGYDQDVDGQKVANHVLVNMRKSMEG